MVAGTNVHDVDLVREGQSWITTVPALNGIATDAEDLDTLDTFVREVIVLAADLPEEAAADLVFRYTVHGRPAGV